MPGQGEDAAEVLECWFVQSRPRQWFAKDPAEVRHLAAVAQPAFLGRERRSSFGSGW
jgi:hypothetical protein